MQGEVDTKALRQQKSTANRNLVAPQVLKPCPNIDRKVNPELLKRVSIITKSIILRIIVRRRSNFLQGERLKNSRPITWKAKRQFELFTNNWSGFLEIKYRVCKFG